MSLLLLDQKQQSTHPCVREPSDGCELPDVPSSSATLLVRNHLDRTLGISRRPRYASLNVDLALPTSTHGLLLAFPLLPSWRRRGRCVRVVDEMDHLVPLCEYCFQPVVPYRFRQLLIHSLRGCFRSEAILLAHPLTVSAGFGQTFRGRHKESGDLGPPPRQRDENIHAGQSSALKPHTPLQISN